MKLLILAGALLAAAIFNQTPPPIPQKSPPPIPVDPLEQMTQFEFQDRQFAYASFVVNRLSSLTLNSNLPSPQTTDQIINQNNCQFLTNGGFYDTQDNHLGLLVSDSSTRSASLQSRLFDGFLGFTNSTANIASSNPQTPNVLQSGPLLLINSNPTRLTIKNDKPARRIIAATNSTNQLVFLVITGADSITTGPYLADLPDIIFNLSTQLDLNHAINLDGGSASAFITPDLAIEEINPIGSYFCLGE